MNNVIFSTIVLLGKLESSESSARRCRGFQRSHVTLVRRFTTLTIGDSYDHQHPSCSFTRLFMSKMRDEQMATCPPKRNSTDECNSRGSPHMTKRRKFTSDLSANIWQQLGSTAKAPVICMKQSPSSRCCQALEGCFNLRLESSFHNVPMQSNPLTIVDDSSLSPVFPCTTAMPSSYNRVHTEMHWLSSLATEIDPALIASLSLHPAASTSSFTDTDAAAGGGLRRRGVSNSRPRMVYNQHIGQLLCAEATPPTPDGTDLLA